MVALAVVGAVSYSLADGADASTSSTTSDGIAWGKVVFGLILLAMAGRVWKRRPAPGETPEMPKWMGQIDTLTPGKSLGLGVLLAGVNPKNLMLTVAAGTALAQLGLPTGDAVGSLVVYVLIASLTIVGPVAYYLVGGENGRTRPRRSEGLARHAQRRRDGGAAAGLRCRSRGQGTRPPCLTTDAAAPPYVGPMSR